MIGQVVSHYKILEKLGEGGMGIVYRAHDMKLDRTVALKFLPPQLSATDQDKTRFLQEARAAAALNHPNVCHIYRIDEVEAPPASGRQGEKLMFIEMEHVDGATLRKRIAAGPLPVSEALNYATQIGEALEEAHRGGIVHRDIKSDNIMINSRGQVKVMDFGLAKLKGALKLTRSSSTVGTLAYMAPEQIQGAEADARSDIFAFGVVLYEMLTGRVPFEGAHEAAMMYSIVNEPPAPLERYVPDAPSELLHVINRSLEKDPEDRYQSVHDMVIDIRRMRKDSTRVSRSSMPAMGVPPGPSAASAAVPAPWRETANVPTPSSIFPAAGSPPPGATSGGSDPGAAAAPGVAAGVPPPAARRTSSVTIQIPTGRKTWAIAASAVVLLALAIVAYLKFGGTDEGTARLSVAVADFQNRTQEPELDGLSGMLTTALEQSKRLSVVTRTHMFDILKQMGKTDVDRIDESTGKEICSKAGIGALVTASIQKFGKLYIIDLKVLDPSKNEYLFTAKEEGEGQESIPAMLDNLSEKTRAGLKERTDEITGSGTDLAAVTTSNMEAYQHYFRGEEYLNKLDMKKAEEEFRRAVALDSLFGLAWYRLAYVVDWSAGTLSLPNDALPKALALIDRLPDKEKYLLRAIAARGKGDFTGPVKILKEMEVRYPDDKEMMYNIGDWSYHANDYSTAVEYLKKTLAVDPVHERALQHLAWTYRDLGQYAGMLETAKKYADVAKSPQSFELLASAYTNSGKIEEGLRDFERLRSAHPETFQIVRAIAGFLIRQGKYGRAEEELLKGVDSSGALRSGAMVSLHGLYTYTGQFKKASAVIASGIARASERGDTLVVVNAMLNQAIAEYFIAGARAKAADLAKQTLRYRIPRENRGFWYAKTFVDVMINPENEIPPDMLGPGTSALFRSIQQSRRHRCSEARAMADSVPSGLPPPPRFTLLISLAHCYYEAGRYNDALSALGSAFSLQEMTTTFMYLDGLALSGKIYEGMGNSKEALKAYGEILGVWKNADPDLPLLVDVQKRVAKLKAVSAN